jgi:hypothetical protein
MLLNISRTALLECARTPSCIVSAITHKLTVPGHIDMDNFFLFWYVELMPQVCLHFSVAPCILMYFHQSSRPNHNIKTDNRSFENLTEYKYLVKAVTDQNDALQKIKRRIHFRECNPVATSFERGNETSGFLRDEFLQ